MFNDAPRPDGSPRLIITRPQAPTVSYPLIGDEVKVGRGPENDVDVQDVRVSRRHLCLRRTDLGWVVEDRGSRHGTLFDGRPLRGTMPLGPGGRVQVGDTVITLETTTDPRGEAASTAEQGLLPDQVRLVGESAPMLEVRALLARISPAKMPVVVSGESGTGKEVAARLLHAMSPRAAGPFAVVHCPSISERLCEAEFFGTDAASGLPARPGRIERAHGGTLFLDEVAELPPPAQARLLRFLQDGHIERAGGLEPIEVDVQVVASTHHDLMADVSRGTFRLDLYYRLRAVEVRMPPLRERREDIPLLVEHILARLVGGGRRLEADALDLLSGHDFPGNVRELEALIMRAAVVASGPVIGADAFALGKPPPGAGDAQGLLQRVDRGESFWEVVHLPFLQRKVPAEVVRALIARAYAEAGASYRKMAARLGATSFKDYKKLTGFLRTHGLAPGAGTVETAPALRGVVADG